MGCWLASLSPIDLISLPERVVSRGVARGSSTAGGGLSGESSGSLRSRLTDWQGWCGAHGGGGGLDCSRARRAWLVQGIFARRGRAVEVHGGGRMDG